MDTATLVKQAIANVYLGNYEPVKRGGELFEYDGFKKRFSFEGDFNRETFEVELKALIELVDEAAPSKTRALKYLEVAEGTEQYQKAVEALDAYPLAKFSTFPAMLEINSRGKELKEFKAAIKQYLGSDVLKAIRKNFKK